MNNDVLSSLVSKATEMALANMWGEDAFKINHMILDLDNSNSAACTRLAKYYKLQDNFTEAKKMYSKALEINPNNQGARNNLLAIEKFENEEEFLQKITTDVEANDAARSLAKAGKYDLMIKCLKKAYSINPLVKYAVSLGKVLKKIGRYDDLKKLYEELCESNQSEQNISLLKTEFTELLQR